MSSTWFGHEGDAFIRDDRIGEDRQRAYDLVYNFGFSNPTVIEPDEELLMQVGGLLTSVEINQAMAMGRTIRLQQSEVEVM